MTLAGIDFLATTLGKPLVEKAMKSALPVEHRVTCAYCERPSDEWYYKDVYVNEKSYDYTEIRCLSCHSAVMPDTEYFGTGKIKSLAGISSLGMLVTETKSIGYATKTHFEKLTSLEPLFDEVIPLSGDDCIADALQKVPEDKPFLLVSAVGQSREKFISSLQVSEPGRMFWFCDGGKGAISVRPHELVQPDDLQGIPKKLLTNKGLGWIDLMRAKTTRYISSEREAELLKLVDENPAIAALHKKMPADPHARNYVLKLAATMLEKLEQKK